MTPVEGRARDRDPRREWAWVVAWFSVYVASLVEDLTHAGRAPYFLVGIAGGAYWQLLHRRDLVSRLTFVAALVTVGIGLVLVTREPFVWDDMDTVGLHAIGVLVGLVFTEQYLRRRDATRRTAEPAPAEHGA